MIILFIIAITMMVVSSSRPKLKKHYNAFHDIYYYIAADVLLWMYHYLYIPEAGIPDYEYLSNLSEKGKFQSYEKEHLKTFKMANKTELEHCDLPILINIILSILHSKYDSYEDEIGKIQDILNEFRENRNFIAHSNKQYINIDSEEEFESMKQRFLENSEKLIIYTQSISGRISTKEASKFFDEIIIKVEADWPKVKEKMSTIIDLEDDGNSNSDNTLQHIEDTIQDKKHNIKAVCVQNDEMLDNTEMSNGFEAADAFDIRLEEIINEDDM